jgi:hypothetical protein
MKRTTVVSPHELCEFAEEHYGISNEEADGLVWWVTPECEVRTRTYELFEIEDEDSEEYSEPKARQLLIDFMTHHKLKEFTLTQ